MKMKRSSAWIVGLYVAAGLFGGGSVYAAEPVTAHLTIRHEETILFDADVTTTTESATNILSILQTADDVSADFAVTDLAYYASFNDYLLNCITFGNPETSACYNWRYTVNSEY